MPQHVDLVLLGGDGATIYSGPLRLAAPYFLSLGVGGAQQGCTEAFLLDLVSSPDGGSPALGTQVIALAGSFLFALNRLVNTAESACIERCSRSP